MAPAAARAYSGPSKDVRKPATPGMPSFVATPEADLRDVYAYIRSIPQAAPSAESVPLIKGILDRRAKAD